MKVLAFIFIASCVSASFYDALDKASDEVVGDFLFGMNNAPSLQEVAGFGYSNYEELIQVEDDIKTELGKTLRDTLNEVLGKIRQSVEHGKEVSRELVQKAKEISDKLKELGQEAGSKAKELLERIREKARDWLRDLLSKIGIGKRGLVKDLLEELNPRALLEKLKEKITNNLNLVQIRDYIKRIFGEFSELGQALLKSIAAKGKEAIKDLISHILPKYDILEEDLNELVEIETHPAHVQKRWIGIAKAACLLVKYVGLGWGKNKLQSWIEANIEPNWRSKLLAALNVGTPALKFLLGRFCYAAAQTGPVDYSLIQLWEKIREFFKGLGLEVQSKFFKFATWLKETVKTGVFNVTEKLEKVKEIAREVIANSKTMSKEVAEQALEFLRPYKEDLGELFQQAKDAIKRVMGGNF